MGLFNILFAWFGLICFVVPICIAVFGGNKAYCNKYCGRGQLFDLLGNKFKLSRKKDIPNFIKSKWFRYGFLIFFMLMFINVIFSTYLVFLQVNDLKQFIKVFWTFKFSWNFAYSGGVSPWIAQFAFAFYSIMLTSTLIGFITMILFKPRSWCVYCPMGTMTQAICKLKYKSKEDNVYGRTSKENSRAFKNTCK